MRFLGRGVATIFAAMLAGLLSASWAAACSCALGSLEEQAAAADVVARVVVQTVDRSEVTSSSADLITYTVVASQVWKGDVGARFDFSSAASEASCGLEFIEEGQELLLFAHADDGGLTSTLCSGTATATEERTLQIEQLLGAGTVPQGTREAPELPGTESGWVIPVLIAVAAVAAVASVLWRRRNGVRQPKGAQSHPTPPVLPVTPPSEDPQ